MNASPRVLRIDGDVKLTALVAEYLAREGMEVEVSGSGRTVTLSQNQPATVSGNGELLRSAIENVVRNALVHAPDSDVEVALQTTPDEAIIRVRDNGAGVPEDALEELFQPFYRVATARPPEWWHWTGTFYYPTRPDLAQRQRARGERCKWRSGSRDAFAVGTGQLRRSLQELRGAYIKLLNKTPATEIVRGINKASSANEPVVKLKFGGGK